MQQLLLQHLSESGTLTKLAGTSKRCRARRIGFVIGVLSDRADGTLGELSTER